MNLDDKILTVLAAGLCAAFLAACPTEPSPSSSTSPAPDRDASFPKPAEDPCDAACAAMRTAGCAEGLDSKCATVCGHVLDAGVVVRLDVSCLARAMTKADVRACGVACR